jgi:hypothetical protein
VPVDRLAQAAYAAYADSLHHPMDEWDELGPDLKEAWRSVADAVVMAIGTKPGDPAETPITVD